MTVAVPHCDDKKKHPQTLPDVLWAWWSETTLVKTHCFDISGMPLPQDLCICSFCLLPGTAGLAPSLGHVCFKHHLNINSLFPLSFLIDLTLLYFALFHLLLPYFNHVLYPGVSFNVQEAQLVKLLASLFTPPQENGLIYLIGLLGKNKMGVFGSVFFFFFFLPLGGVSPSMAGERTCSTYAVCDSVGKLSSI